MTMNTMTNKLSTLKILEELLVDKKKKDLQLFQSKLMKHNTIAIYNSLFESIKKLKDFEKEKSRIDWKNGYIESVINCGEAFGNSREESYPTKEELELIDKLSRKY